MGKLARSVIVRLDARGVRGDGTSRDWTDRLHARGRHWYWTASPCAAMMVYLLVYSRVGKTCGGVCWRNFELLLPETFCV